MHPINQLLFYSILMQKIPFYIVVALLFFMNFGGHLPNSYAQRGYEEPKLKRQKLDDGVSVLMPETFRKMTDDELAGKYFTYRKPVVMFTDDRGQADIGLNYSATKWSYADLDILKDFYFSTFSNMYGEIHMIDEGIRRHGNYKFAYFEFTADVRDDSKIVERRSKPVYVYIMYTVQGDKILLVNYNCPKRNLRYQQPIARQMMESLKIIGKPQTGGQ